MTPPQTLPWALVATGHSREFAWLAWALDRDGRLGTLTGPFPNGVSRLPGLVERWPPVARELGKRHDVPALDPASVRAVVPAHEIAQVALGRWSGTSRLSGVVSRHKHAVLGRIAGRLQLQHHVVAPDSVPLTSGTAAGRRVVYAAAAQRAVKREQIAAEPGHLRPTRRDEDHALDATLRGADLVWTSSSYSAATYEAVGVDRSRILVAGLGVDTARFDPALRRRADDDGVVRVLYAGRVTRGKGVTDLAEVVRELGHPYRLAVVGPEDGTVRVPAASNIEKLGSVSTPEMARHMADADVVVLPSYSDAFGLTGLEAMASGRPTILSTRTFGPDLVRDGHDAFLIEPGDRARLHDLLRQLQDPELRSTIGARARETAERHTWADVAPRLATDLGARWA